MCSRSNRLRRTFFTNFFELIRESSLLSYLEEVLLKGVHRILEIVRYGGYAALALATLPAPMAWLTMVPVPVPAALSAVLRPVLSCPAVLLSCCPTICPIPIPGRDHLMAIGPCAFLHFLCAHYAPYTQR